MTKLPRWKTLIFSLIPTLLLFSVVELGARVIWNRLEAEALAKDPNKVISFHTVPHPVLGYRLAPNLDTGAGTFAVSVGRFDFRFEMHLFTNAQSYMQRDNVEEKKLPGALRILTVGESTTQGHDVDENYPSILRRMAGARQTRYSHIEVINAGVPGWISDQWAALSEIELSRLRPDVVIFYAGWNDFQAYSPYAGPPEKSWFVSAYSYLPGMTHFLRSLTLAQKFFAPAPQAAPIGSYKNGLIGLKSLQGAEGAANGVVPISQPEKPNFVSPPRGYGWVAIEQPLPLESGKLTIALWAKGSGKGSLRIGGLQKPWPMYQNCPFDLSETASLVTCEFVRPTENKGLQISFMATTPVEASIYGLRLLRGTVSLEEMKNMNVGANADSEQLYHFFLLNLDRAIKAFRLENPNTKIVVSTLVGRWPYESESYFLEGTNLAVWWMKRAGETSASAAAHLERFNNVIRSYAAAHDVILIDTAREFKDTKREEIMWDFAHFTDVGYRKLGTWIYQQLRDKGIFDLPIEGVKPVTQLRNRDTSPMEPRDEPAGDEQLIELDPADLPTQEGTTTKPAKEGVELTTSACQWCYSLVGSVPWDEISADGKLHCA